MFKKLKQKINEEQSPQRNVLSPQQAQVSSGEKQGKSPLLHQDAPSSSRDRENITKGTVSTPSGSVNGDGAVSPLASSTTREESQSLAQKLQQRVSSVESLFRVSGRAEGLFRSGSRDSLVRSASRESLTPLGENETSGAPAFDPPSDIESEAEDAPGNAEALSKEQLVYRLHRVEKSLANYRGKYSELVTAYRIMQRDKEKTQAVLSQSQDKTLRRLGELREELQMDQQAKKHLQEEFDAALEEKDQMITVLQTQVALMKKRLHGCPEASVSSEAGDTQTDVSTEMTSDPLSTPQVEGVELNQAGGTGEPRNTADLEVLQKRVRRQEMLLQSCKELINTNKERSAQLSSENDALQQQLQERLQELEKMKDLHTSEKTKLITQLRDAKNLIEQLEQDKGMVIAETKRQMHETLEMKEEEIAQLRTKIQQIVGQKEELQEQREKAEKAAFEELERALAMAQRAEEARRQLQERMEEQVKQVEQASEEERRSLQQELTRVKQEVITIMKKSTEDRIAEMEQQHLEDLANKDKQMSIQINEAVENCRKELLKAAEEKEQQASLAVEEAELQKSAVQAEGEAKARELQLELESTRTKILELESSLAKLSQGEATQADQLSAEIEEQRKKHEGEIAALKERHQQELENMLAEQTGALNQQHSIVEELVQKHKSEIDTMMKDKELEFQEHVKEMNQKMLEKLDIKQAELETLSSELSEMQKFKEQLEEKLAGDAANESARTEFEVRLTEEQSKFQTEVDDLKRQHEQMLEGLEKTLKEELNQLRSSEKESLAEADAQSISLKEELKQSKSQVQNLERLLEEGRIDCKQKEECLLQKTNENENLQQKIQQALNDLAEKETKMEKLKQKAKEIQEKLKKKLHEQEESAKAEIAKKDKELQEKDQQANHKEQLEKIQEVHRLQQEELLRVWQEKLSQQEEELQEKHALEEKEQIVQEVKNLREELSMRETTVQKLQTELREAAVKLESLSEDQLTKAEETTSRSEEDENLQRSLEEKATELRNKETEFLTQTCGINHLCKRVECKIEDMEKQIGEKEEHLQRLTASIDDQTIKKLQVLEKEFQNVKQQLESQQGDFEKEKAEILKSKEKALKAAEESACKKEQTIGDLQVQLEDIKQRQNEKEQQVKSLEENGRKMEEAINNLMEEHKKHLEQDMDKEELAAATAATVNDREEEAFSRIRELEAKLIESEEQNTICQAEITQLKAELCEQIALVQELQKTCLNLEVQYAGEQDSKIKQEAWEAEKGLLVKDYEMKLQDVCKRLEEKEVQLKVQENLQLGLGQTDEEGLADGSKISENSLQRKLVELENEKQKIQKDYTRLQKDLRSLRKEHEKDLEYMRKEMAEESEKKLKLEVEDLEMKQNSTLKQMMREFNTQVALKDKELEASVKEAVEKAQRVETELMGIHRDEVNQLQKLISQKEEDLKRSIQRYEQILQSREEEMGTRVLEVKKELEELQQRSLSGPQGVEELQVQLAEKTTLLSEARLKEQVYQDRIHTLEDTVRKAYKNSVVTHLGKEPSHYNVDPFTEPTEFEYLRKVMFEYMMGRETKTMAKVITSMLKFPADQAQKVLEREDSRVMPWLR
ncbi:hypothetical protein QTP86_030008 [Hemibagrus guttatus]|nr:hypothetical protein QTP86_030008 [Hemibagrus guttatus]